MKFTMHIPVGDITPGEFQSRTAIAEMAQALEKAGIDACYVTDHPAPSAAWLHANGHDALDPFTALAFVAAASTRLKLHTNILVLPYRNPFVVAKAAVTLQVLSDGRLILGVGAGYQKAEFEALGVDFHKRGVLFDEALEVLALAWGGGAVAYQGRNFTTADSEPRPTPRPLPLVWIGGGSDKALDRAARFGDGWSPFFTREGMTTINQNSGIHSVAQLHDKIRLLNEKRHALGKSGPIDIIIGPRRSITRHTREEADRYIEALNELEAVGATWAMVDVPHPTRTAYLESVSWFAEEVVRRR